MIINLLVNFIVLVFGALFSFFPVVLKLPTVFGFDIDTAMAAGMGSLNTFMTSFWPIKYMFMGFLAIMAYYGLKMIVTFLLGHRAPGQK
jgi:hypothetical protein